jgi:hypothetical protein
MKKIILPLVNNLRYPGINAQPGRISHIFVCKDSRIWIREDRDRGYKVYPPFPGTWFSYVFLQKGVRIHCPFLSDGDTRICRILWYLFSVRSNSKKFLDFPDH